MLVNISFDIKMRHEQFCEVTDNMHEPAKKIPQMF